ncbi:MAG: 16S rRNA (guanine(527)-N(7))-methyltransferase RsmG [Planctomycetota bacterium]
MRRRRPLHPLRRARSRPREKDSLARLGSLCAATGLDPPEQALAPLLAYLERMLLENRRLNLTGIRDPEQALVLHVVDSLQVWRAAPTPRRVLDLGSGNGFPGVAAACLWPEAKVVLVERTRKKADALDRCLNDSALARVEVLPLDAAQIPALRPGLRADLVLARAVGALSALIPVAAPLMRNQALLVNWHAAETDAGEGRATQRAARRHGLVRREDLLYVLPGPRARRLVSLFRP